MNPVMVFQPVSKFGMFDFVVSYTVCFIVLFFLIGGANKIFGFLGGEQKRGNLQRKGAGQTTLGWNYGTEVKGS